VVPSKQGNGTNQEKQPLEVELFVNEAISREDTDHANITPDYGSWKHTRY
jgi:hypothetical protein